MTKKRGDFFLDVRIRNARGQTIFKEKDQPLSKFVKKLNEWGMW